MRRAPPARRATIRRRDRLRALLRGLTVAVAAVLGGLVLVAPAYAADCFPAGGGQLPDLDSEADGTGFRFVGRGWGHGVGMSQFGARGAARLGCSAEDILTTYYPGVRVADAGVPEGIRVSLFPDRPAAASGRVIPSVIRVEARDGELPWRLRDGSSSEEVARQPQGEIWRVRVREDGSYRLLRENSDGSEGSERWAGGGRSVRLQAVLDGSRTVYLSSKDRRYRHGALEFFSGGLSGAQMYVTVRLPSIETYLRGLAEMPSSWEHEALRAQAIVGRSYAVDRRLAYPNLRSDCDCHLFDSTWDQVYSGYEKEAEGTGGQFGARWVAAVEATRGVTIRSGDRVAVGYYSSSHGGHSESNAFVWGGTPLAYLQPVDDSRWEQHAQNPNLAWRADFSAAEVGRRLGVGVALDVELPEPKGSAGRIGHPNRGYGGVVVTGTEGTRTFSGDEVRQRLGIRSTLFDVVHAAPPRACLPPAEERVGDVVDRAGGADRYDTAVRLARRGWGDEPSVDTVVLASGRDFPDALAGGALAGALDAPLLLTRPDRLPEEVARELLNLGPQRVLLLGGEAAIAPAVEQRVREIVGDVERVQGRDRFGTAAAIAERVGSDGTVLLALGRHADPGRAWPDALAAGAFAAAGEPRPVLLGLPDRLPDVTRDALRELDAERVVLVGGSAAIGDQVAAELEADGLTVDRLSGADRYGTSAAVAAAVLDELPAADELLFATGADFPDGLTAGALAARTGTPLLLVPHCDLDGHEATLGVVGRSQLGGGLVIGGQQAVSERVRWQLEQRLR